MKLTNYMREAFVRAVMKDTPKADTEALEKEAHKIVLDDALSKCPTAIRAAWAKNELRPFVNARVETFYFRALRTHAFSQLAVPCGPEGYSMSDAVLQKVMPLAEKAVELQKARLDLERRLEGVVKGCTTRKQLAEALPEFTKYLPEDEAAGTRSLPVVANVVADFVKAGWPKGGKKVQA